MLSVFLKAKLHHLTVTAAELNYQGSLTLDPDFMEMVGLRQFEKILVANLENGERFETYAIPGRPGSGEVCLNGAAAHKGKVGDRLIVMSWCEATEAEAAAHRPRVVRLDAANRPVKA